MGEVIYRQFTRFKIGDSFLDSVIIDIIDVSRLSYYGDAQVHGLCYVVKGKPGYFPAKVWDRIE
jgi:hypothetical protein